MKVCRPQGQTLPSDRAAAAELRQRSEAPIRRETFSCNLKLPVDSDPKCAMLFSPVGSPPAAALSSRNWRDRRTEGLPIESV